MINRLGASLVSEFFYCPRSFAYRLVDFKPLEETNYYLLDGRFGHERLEKKKNTFNREGRKEVRGIELHSKKYPLSCKIDRVVFLEEGVKIIEEKRGSLRENIQHDIQCVIEKVIWDELNPDLKCVSCLIYYQSSKRYREVDLSLIDKLKVQIESVLELTKEFDLERFSPVYDLRCRGCMYQSLCGSEL